mgnify:FL=1
MEQLSLNKEILKEICEKSQSTITCYPPFVADIAEKFVREIAQEFAMYCMDELGYDQSTIIDEQFETFLKQKYK